ncbi:reverse transcriptase domain-containing protein [Tanacetum coccineum]
MEEPMDEIGEITFPSVSGSNNSSDPVIMKVRISGRQVNRVYMDSGSSCEVIYEHCFLKLNPSIRALQVDSKILLVGFSREHSCPLGEVPLEVTIGESPYTRIENLNFVIIRFDSPHNLLLGRTAMQKMDMTRIPRTIMVGENPFNTEHKLNVYKHIKPVKQKKRGLGPDRNEVACKEVDELTKAGILRKAPIRQHETESKKCSFGVEEGPFLGHLLTKQGIRANPSKVKAVTNLEPLRTLKDVQSLNGKLAVLRQFLSKGAEKSFSFFKTLMSCTDKKTIQWTEDAERDLQRMNLRKYYQHSQS